jgi:hypothetical protein
LEVFPSSSRFFLAASRSRSIIFFLLRSTTSFDRKQRLVVAHAGLGGEPGAELANRVRVKHLAVLAPTF